jgi:hypothetical protein
MARTHDAGRRRSVIRRCEEFSMSESVGGPQILGKLYLFQQPELLNRETHEGLGLTPPAAPFSFCAKSRIAPLTIHEVGAASKCMPIIFMSRTNLVPLAVLGIIDDVNLFVNDDGSWDQDAYAPAYLRRYPFAFAGDADSERFAVVIDRAFPGISREAAEPFFANGAPSEAMQKVVEFCKVYESERIGTERMMKDLESFDLLSPQGAQFTPIEGGEPRTIAQYFGIDPSKFENLSDQSFLELRKKGLLPIIYATLLSSANWRTLLNKRARKFNLAGDAVYQPLAPV